MSQQLKPVYTTGDVARICQVATRTVVKWIEQGLLPHYRIPGSRERRVTHDNLEAFLVNHGMPTDGLHVVQS